MDYSKMSDFEINKRVAVARGLMVQEIDDNKSVGMTSRYHELRPHTVWVSDGNNPWEQYAPTLCWEDAGPVINEHRIMLNPYCADELWKCELPCLFDGLMTTYAAAYDKNPLRAAMVVYLMMQEAK